LPQVGERASVRLSGPARVALVVLALYCGWTGAYLATGGDVRDFIRIGTAFIEGGNGHSRAIRLDPGYRPPANQNPAAQGQGYDGQFSYYIALDPSRARYYIDIPPLRYGRILYPILSRYLVLGRRAAIPWAMLLINLLAVAGGTWALAAWLCRRGASPHWALVYGLWPGMVIGVQRDLTEPLAYGLVAAGLLVLETGSRWRWALSGLVFGLAGLARQTTVLFPLVIGAWLLFARARGEHRTTRSADARDLACFIALSLVPLIAYSVFLYAWLGSLSTGGDLTWVPFGGLFHGPLRAGREGVNFVFVLLPVLVALAALAPVHRSTGDERWLPWLLIVANVLLYVVFYGQLHNATYTSVSRDVIGVVLAALLAIPSARALSEPRARSLAGATALAMVMLPVVAVYGFTNVSA
jgi:hypothetical protein